MKNKFFFLSTIISSCIFTITCNQFTAQEMSPYMPTGGKQSCYPASKCTGDPNLIGGNRGYGGNQTCPSNNGRGSNGNYSNSSYYNGNSSYSYDNQNNPSSGPLQTESTEKLNGTVKSVNRVTLPNQSQIQLIVTTDQGDMLVILGPSNFVDQSKIKMQAGDKIAVTGYRIKANGNDVMIAAQVQKNGNTLQLLDEQRNPLWENPANTQNSDMKNGQNGMQNGQNGMQNGQNGIQNPTMPYGKRY